MDEMLNNYPAVLNISEVAEILSITPATVRRHATGLTDTPENIKKASEIRIKLLNKKSMAVIDRNITLADYIDHILEKKKREVADTTYSVYEYRSQRIKQGFGDTMNNIISLKDYTDQ